MLLYYRCASLHYNTVCFGPAANFGFIRCARDGPLNDSKKNLSQLRPFNLWQVARPLRKVRAIPWAQSQCAIIASRQPCLEESASPVDVSCPSRPEGNNTSRGRGSIRSCILIFIHTLYGTRKIACNIYLQIRMLLLLARYAGDDVLW